MLSVLAQSLADVEVVVVDDASTDDTAHVLESYERWDSRVVVVHSRTKLGRADARNAGIACARGEFLAILDADELHLDNADDLVDALRREAYDLIRVADVGVAPHERGASGTLGQLLAQKNSSAFYSLGFVPAVIFRSAAVEPHVKAAYYYTHTRYQQLFVLMRSFGEEATVYTTREPVLTRGSAPTPIGCEIYDYWLRSIEAIPGGVARENALKCIFPSTDPFRFGRSMLSDVRCGRPNRSVLRIWSDVLRRTPTLRSKMVVILNFPFALVPLSIIRPLYPVLRRKPFIPGRFDGGGRSHDGQPD